MDMSDRTNPSMCVSSPTHIVHPFNSQSRKLPLSDCTGNAFMTTVVARGRARGLVVRTGPHTEIGRISAAVTAGAQKKVRTPVQRKLSRLGKYLVALAVVLCVLVVVVGVAWKRNVKDMINVGLRCVKERVL